MTRSSIGRKFIMAVTGILLFGFVVVHMLGNLQIFLGPDAINSYAHKLEELGPLLWMARFGLLAVFVAHIGCSISLARDNAAARPIAYHFPNTVQASYASLTMLYTGLLILAFVVYHLLHFTFRWVHYSGPLMTRLGHSGIEVRDVYSMVVLGFQVWYISLAYMIAQVILGAHLSHGMTSVFQTLGLNSPKYWPVIAWIGPVAAGVIVLGNVSMPAAVLAGFVQRAPMTGS